MAMTELDPVSGAIADDSAGADPVNLEQRQRIFEDVIIQRMKVLQEFVKRNVNKLDKRIGALAEK
jgi:hypothetical protein